MIKALNTSLTGMQKASSNVAKAADNIVDPQKNTEITEDILDIKINENNFKANALVAKTAKDLQEELYESLDIKV